MRILIAGSCKSGYEVTLVEREPNSPRSATVALGPHAMLNAPTDFLAWRTVMPIENYMRQFANTLSWWLCASRHVVRYPIRPGTQHYAGFYVPATEIHLEDFGDVLIVTPKDQHVAFDAEGINTALPTDIIGLTRRWR